MRQYRLPPPIVSHPLEQNGRSWFAVVVPLARTNMVINGSFETNLGNYGNDGVSSARVTTQQYHGAYSMELTPSAGQANAAVYYSTVSLVSGTSYVASCKFLGVANRAYRIAFATTAGVALATYTFKATGRWQWIWVFYKETSTTTRRIYIGKNNDSANVSPYYVDGVQCESLADGVLAPTTYIDGDQAGLVPNQFPPAYLWDGTPHGSTSQRSGQTRAGGYVMPLSRYGFLLLSIIGLGMISPSHVATPYAQLDGAEYQRSLKGPRQFTLAGRIDARTPAQLDRLHAGLAEVIDRDYIGQQQPVTLLYQKWDGDRPISDYGRMIGLYTGGMGETKESLHSMPVTPTFQMYFPVVLSDKEEGAALTVQQSVSNANAVLLRSPAGVWSAIGTGAAGGNVYAIAQGLDGAYYIGGSFTSFGGVADTNRIAKYDPTTGTISALGTGATSGTVNDIQVAPNGDIWAIGSYQNMGGVAAADYVSRWDGVAWNGVGTPTAIAGGVTQLTTFGIDGKFYYAVGATLRQWDGAAWSTVGTAAGGAGIMVNVIRAPSGKIVVTGNFTSVSAVSATNIAAYDPIAGTWAALSGSIPAVPNAHAYDAAGVLYAGGAASSSNLWSHNGVTWTQIGIIGTVATTIRSIAPANDGRGMYVGGTFTTANGVTFPDRFGLWNGAALVPADADIPGTPTVYAMRAFRDGSLGIGYDQTGTATTAANTTVTASTKAYPILTIKGPSSGTSRIYQIINYTTGRSIWLNLTLNAGETAVLSFDPKNLSFVSDFQGNVASKILPGSNEADFFLQRGANAISFFAAGSSVTATLRWRPIYDELASLTP